MEKNDLKRKQLLAGIITESEFNEEGGLLNEQASTENKELTKQEQDVLDDILKEEYSLNEAASFSNVINKVKKYAKQGLLTGAVLASLLSSPAFSQVEKDEIKQVASKEMTSTTSGEDLLAKFHKLMKAHSPKDGEFKKISSDPHSSEFERTKNVYGDPDTTYSYDNKDALNPNVDLNDVAENIDSKVIQQKYNWIIKNMEGITPSNSESFKKDFERLQGEFASRFPDSKMDTKKFGEENTIVFDHTFKQNDGYAQGPKSYKTSDGKTIEVGERIPQSSHVIDFYAGTIKPEVTSEKTPIKDTVNLVQIKMKPITVPLDGTKEQQQKTIKNFKDIFQSYGEVIHSGDHLTLDPTFMGVVEKDKADEQINQLNDEIKKLGDQNNMNFKGNVFSKASSVDKIK